MYILGLSSDSPRDFKVYNIYSLTSLVKEGIVYMQIFGPRTFRKKIQLKGFLFVLPVLLYFVVVYWSNLVQVFYLSFQEVGARNQLNFAGFSTYANVFSEKKFWQSLLNTGMFISQTIVLTIVLGVLITILIYNLKHSVLQKIATISFVIPMLVSLVAAGIIWKWIYHTRFGPINQMFQFVGLPRLEFLLNENQAMPSMAVINSWVRVGYAVLILQAGLQGIPTTVFDSACVDGASGFKLYWHIIFPLLIPHITAVALLEIIFAVGAFDIIYVTTQGGPADSTRVIMLYLYDNAFRFNRPDKAAVVSVIIFVILLVVGIIQRKFVSGKEYEY